jgi:hypothetical protein
VKIYAGEEDTDTGVELLKAIKSVFKDKRADWLSTKDIIEALVTFEDGPWASWFEDSLKHDKLRTAGSRLARQLKRYRSDGVEHSKTRVGDETAWGYTRDCFKRAWERYLGAPTHPPGKHGTDGTDGTDGTQPDVTMEKPCSMQTAPTWNVPSTPVLDGTQKHLGKTPDVPSVPSVPCDQNGEENAVFSESGSPDFGAMSDAEFDTWFNKTKTVYPGDWLRFRNEAEFHEFFDSKRALPITCCGLSDSPDSAEILAHDPIKVDLNCDSKLTGDCAFYYHPKTGSARCDCCQEAEYWAQYFDVENGFPFGDWQATTEERRAQWEAEAERRCQASQRWAKSPEGQAWLEKSNLQFAERLKAKAREQGWTREKLYAEAEAYGLIPKAA